jgi:hypothetical protein
LCQKQMKGINGLLSGLQNGVWNGNRGIGKHD